MEAIGHRYTVVISSTLSTYLAIRDLHLPVQIARVDFQIAGAQASGT